MLRLGIEGELNRIRKQSIDSPYERLYDSIVSAGEILSSIILHAAIQTKFPNASWLDSRMVIKTNSSHKRAEINLEYTERRMRKLPLQCSFIHSAGGQGCSLLLTSQRSQVLRNSPIHTFSLNEAGDVL